MGSVDVSDCLAGCLVFHGPTLQSGVERETSGSHDQVTQEGNEEDPIMAMLRTIVHALDGKVDEQQVRKSIDDLGGIVGDHIVLRKTTIQSEACLGAFPTIKVNIPLRTSLASTLLAPSIHHVSQADRVSKGAKTPSCIGV
jgi:hypothetical protein